MSEPLAENLFPALRNLHSWMNADGIDYAIIGGVAISLTSQPRFTNDVDIVASVDSDKWQALLESGARHGFAPRIADPLAFARRSRVLLLSHVESGISLDIAFGALPFEVETIEKAFHIDLGGIRLPVARPEDLIVMKAIARRPKDDIDVDALLRANPDLDLGRIRHIVREFADLLDAPEISANLDRAIARAHDSRRDRPT